MVVTVYTVTRLLQILTHMYNTVTRTHTHTCMYALHTYTRIHMHTQSLIHVHTHLHIHVHTNSHIHTLKYIRTHTHQITVLK